MVEGIKRERTIPLVSLENFKEFDERKPLNSPRSLEACKHEGIDPKKLIKRDMADFLKEGASERIATMRFNFYEQQRREMLITVKKAREKIILKLENTKKIKPGTFLTPVGRLLQREKTIDFSQGIAVERSRRRSSIGKSPQLDKYLTIRNEMDQRKMGHILRNEEKHDINMRRNIELALERMRKSVEIDSLTEQERLQKLQESERNHIMKRILAKNQFEIETRKQQKKENEIVQSKSQHRNEMFSTLQDFAREKLKDQYNAKLQFIESEEKHKEMIERKEKAYEMQERLRKKKENKMKRKLQLIEQKRQQRKKELLEAMNEKKKKDTEKLNKLKANLEEINQAKQSRKSELLATTPMPLSSSRAQTANISRVKLELAQTEAARKTEERRQKIQAKITAFNERMKAKELEMQRVKAEKEEQARLWRLKLKVNIEKKQRREKYKKTLLEQKINAVDKQHKLLQDHQSTVMAERFYAKLNGEMKNYYLQEALHDMAIRKAWSLQRLDGIMEAFKPRLPNGPVKNKSQILRQISKTLSTPFKTAQLYNCDNNAEDEELIESFEDAQSQY